MSHPVVVRGGRGPSREALEAEAARAAKAREEEGLQRKQDLRALMARHDFRRIATWLITESQMFAVPIGFPHDVLREWTGRAALGQQLFNACVETDPTFATFILTITPKQDPTP